MPFLAINGLTLSVLDKSATKAAPIVIGDRARSVNGALRVTQVALKRSWAFTTAHQNPTDAEAWRRLLTLDTWDAVTFDSDLYSAKGVGPSSSSGATAGVSSPKYGAGRMSLAATTGTITYDFALGSVWSVSVWQDPGTGWTHRFIRSDGAKWIDGVRNDAFGTGWLSVDGSGNVTLQNTSGSTLYMDDLVVFGWLVPTTWPPIVAADTAAFSCPGLTATGTFIDNAPKTVEAQVGETGIVQAVLDGTGYPDVQTMQVTLEEQ